MFQYEYDLDESHESTPEDKRQDLRRQSKEQGNLFKLSVRKKTKQSFENAILLLNHYSLFSLS